MEFGCFSIIVILKYYLNIALNLLELFVLPIDFERLSLLVRRHILPVLRNSLRLFVQIGVSDQILVFFREHFPFDFPRPPVVLNSESSAAISAFLSLSAPRDCLEIVVNKPINKVDRRLVHRESLFLCALSYMPFLHFAVVLVRKYCLPVVIKHPFPTFPLALITQEHLDDCFFVNFREFLRASRIGGEDGCWLVV